MKRANNTSLAFRPPKRRITAENAVAVKSVSKDEIQDAEIKKLKAQVKRLAKKPEVKVKYFGASSTTPAYLSGRNAYTIGFSSIAGGSGEEQRVGNQIRAKRLIVRLHMLQTGSSYPIRIIIFNDKQHGASAAISAENITGTDVSLLEDAGFTGSYPITAQTYQHDMAFRFHVYRDVVFDYRQGTQNVPVVLNFDIPLDLVVQYDDAGGTYADVLTNMIQLYVGLSNTAGSGTPLTISMGAQIQFTDS